MSDWELWIPDGERRRISGLPPRERSKARRWWYWAWLGAKRPEQGRLFEQEAEADDQAGGYEEGDWGEVWVTNPDVDLRGLEREAATDPGALLRLQRALNRSGRCGLRQADITHSTGTAVAPYAVTQEEVKICFVCASLDELEALRDHTRWSGYLDGLSDKAVAASELPGGIFGPTKLPGWPAIYTSLPPHGMNHVTVSTFVGFPLLIVRQLDCRPLSTPSQTCWWQGTDLWGREWYGRNAGLGMSTNMKTRVSSQERPGYTSEPLAAAQAAWIRAHTRR